MTSRNEVIQVAKEKARSEKAAAASRRGGTKAYRSDADGVDEELLNKILEVERQLDSVKADPRNESNEALLFTRTDGNTFLELIYRAAHELNLVTEVDAQKFKVTLRSNDRPMETEEEQMDRLFDV